VRFTDKSEIEKEIHTPGKVFYGKASYYADAFHGKVTASGEIFDMTKLTAAHRSLPYGTILQIRNIKNNKTIVVRVNDRGPFKGNRVIDVSKAAAEALDMIRDGIIDVEITILE
jgi:rare lipoprotein A